MNLSSATDRRSRSTTEPAWVRLTLTALALGYLAVFLLTPLVSVFYEALSKGLSCIWRRWSSPRRWRPSS